MDKDISNTVILRGSEGDAVKIWQIYLQRKNYLIENADGIFGQLTEDATKKFQSDHGLIADGIVGKITRGFMASMEHPAPNIIKSEKDLLFWIHQNLGPIIKKAIDKTIYTEDWVGSIVARETGFLVVKYANRGMSLSEISALTKGDFRNGIFHGYGLYQIDIGSYPDFVKSEKWKDPELCTMMAISVLESKRIYLAKYEDKLGQYLFEFAITSAYNTGQGNVAHEIEKNENTDNTTTGHNYAADVFSMRKIYKQFI
jgi:peptidoglycan hydrolase-like protein with peptidoglycan-binding domain